MSSQVQICNLALARIGILQGIDSIDEASNEARACSQAWDLCRDEVLAVHAWPMSARTAVLGLVGTDPTDAWGYSYRLPADCLVAGSIGDKVPFQITSDSAGGLLYCNVDTPTLAYTARVEDVSLWPPDLVGVLVGRLAIEIAPPLARTDAVVARAQARFDKDLAAAVQNRQNEQVQGPPPDAEAISARE